MIAEAISEMPTLSPSPKQKKKGKDQNNTPGTQNNQKETQHEEAGWTTGKNTKTERETKIALKKDETPPSFKEMMD